MSKTTMTGELSEAFAEGNHGCALCSLWAKEEERMVAMIRKEGAPANSPLRERIIASTGFCNRHTHIVLKDDEFGGSASAQLVLKKVEDSLEGLLAEVRGAKGFGSEQLSVMIGRLEKTLYGDTICPVCETLLKSDKERLTSLLQMLESKEMAERYGKSDAMCLPHLVSAMKLLTSVPMKDREHVWNILIKAETARLEAVDKILNDRMQKYSWDYRDQGLTAEEAGAQRAGNMMLSGVEGLYTRNRKTSLRPAKEK
jgi:hypothetical protein